MDRSYIIYPAIFSFLVFKVIQYWGHFRAVSLTSGRVKYICKFIFVASFKGRKKIILKLLNSKVYKYFWCSREYSLRTSGKILPDVFRRFHRVATIAGKAGKAVKAGKYLFFEVLLGKLENDTLFFCWFSFSY